jgi:adenine-specific DNA-methyltransferase
MWHPDNLPVICCEGAGDRGIQWASSTKREVGPAVCEVIECCQAGMRFDAFAGICSVGELIAPRRQVWCNDVQVFAATFAKALFASEDARHRLSGLPSIFCLAKT